MTEKTQTSVSLYGTFANRTRMCNGTLWYVYHDGKGAFFEAAIKPVDDYLPSNHYTSTEKFKYYYSKKSLPSVLKFIEECTRNLTGEYNISLTNTSIVVVYSLKDKPTIEALASSNSLL